ncbi:MAG: TetR/AcrR family transcriptional regulator [Ornithinibacter sp.]
MSTTMPAAGLPDSTPGTALPGAADGLGLRDRKKLATRARIHREAVALALERGVDGVTVEEIAAAADVSPRTFFNYFATKEDAFVGADPTAAERLAAAVLARPANESTLTAVRVVLVEHLAALEADEELWKMRRRLAAGEPALAARLAGANDRLEGALVDAAYQRTGADPARDLRPALGARVAMAAVRAAVGSHVASGFRGSLRRRLDEAFAVVDPG